MEEDTTYTQDSSHTQEHDNEYWQAVVNDIQTTLQDALEEVEKRVNNNENQQDKEEEKDYHHHYHQYQYRRHHDHQYRRHQYRHGKSVLQEMKSFMTGIGGREDMLDHMANMIHRVAVSTPKELQMWIVGGLTYLMNGEGGEFMDHLVANRDQVLDVLGALNVTSASELEKLRVDPDYFESKAHVIMLGAIDTVKSGFFLELLTQVPPLFAVVDKTLHKPNKLISTMVDMMLHVHDEDKLEEIRQDIMKDDDMMEMFTEVNVTDPESWQKFANEMGAMMPGNGHHN